MKSNPFHIRVQDDARGDAEVAEVLELNAKLAVFLKVDTGTF